MLCQQKTFLRTKTLTVHAMLRDIVKLIFRLLNSPLEKLMHIMSKVVCMM